MALTPEQKLQIQKKVKQFEAEGLNTQESIKRAFSEIAGPTALADTISQQSKGTAVAPVALPKPKFVNPNVESETTLIRNEYNKARTDFIKTRRDELKSLGYTDAVAESMAASEFQKSFGTPMEGGFGEYGERKGEVGIPLTPIKTIPTAIVPEISRDPGLFDALRPQVFFSPGASKKEELSRFDTSVTAEKTEINWADVKDALSASGLKGAELDNYLEGLKAAYEIKRTERRGKKASGLDKTIEDPALFAQKTLEETMAELGAISSAPVISDPEEAASKKTGEITVSDVLGKQVEAGKEKKAYSPAQSAYIEGVRKKTLEGTVDRRLESGDSKNVWKLKNGTEISEEEYASRQEDAIAKKKQDTSLEGAISISRKLTRQEVTADEEKKFQGQVSRDFTLSAEKLAEYKRDPVAFSEKYKEGGILTDTSVLGGQKETTFGQGLRIILAPSNALAGAVSPYLFEGQEFTSIFGSEYGGDPEFVAQEKRRSRPELYKDNPILYNIAKNRGFLGEGIETAEILGLEGTAKGLYLAGTFAADALDPTFEIMKGVGVATKTAKGAYNASAALKAIDNASRGGRAVDAAVVGAKAGLNDFLDSIAFGKAGRMLDIPENIVEKIPVVGPKIKAGSKITRDTLRKITGLDDLTDPRTLAATDLARSLDASTEASRRIAANAEATVDEVAKELAKSDKYKDSTYANAFAKEAKKNPAGPASVLAARIKASESLIEEAENIIKGVDELKTGSTNLVRNKEVARQLGNLASSDPDVATRLRAVDAAPTEGRTKLSEYVEALSEDQLERLKRSMLHSEAATAVYRASKESNIPIGNLVAATKNVMVDKKLLPEIMKAAKESVVGKIADELRDSKISFKEAGGLSFKEAGGQRQVGRQIAQVYNLTTEQAATLKERISELVNFRRIDDATAERITDNLANGFITTKDLRSLIDNEVDQIAESAASAGKVVERSRDVARLPISAQLERLVPLEARSFTRTLLKDFINKTTGNFTQAASKMSVGQKAILKEAGQKMASLDVKLRTTMKDLVGLKQNKEVRDLYGIDGDLTPQEALAYAITGPTAYRASGTSKLRETLEFALNNLFYSKETKENIFDLFSGTTVSRDTSVFTAAGRKKYFENEQLAEALKEGFDTNGLGEAAILEKIAEEVAENPRILWQKLEEVSAQIRADLADPAKRAELFNDPNSVIDIVKQGESRSGRVLGRYDVKEDKLSRVLDKFGEKGLARGSIPPEISLGMYYKTEANEISKGIIYDLVNKEIGKGSLDPLAAFDENYLKYINDVFMKAGIQGNMKESYIKLVANRVKASLQNPNFKTTPMSAEDVSDVFLAQSRLKREALKEREILIEAIKKEADEAIDQLNKRPGLFPVIDRKKVLSIEENRDAKIKKIKEQSTSPTSERGKRLLEQGKLNDMARAAELLNDPAFKSIVSNLTESANDVAAGIKRSNGLSDVASISKVEDEITKIIDLLKKSKGSSSDADIAQLNLLFGEDVQKQIVDNLSEGFKILKKDLTNELVRNYENSSMVMNILNGIRDIYWFFNDLRYTLLLNLRPRFHSVNLGTAGEIVSQTTGKLPNYADVAEGLLLSVTSQRNPNKIILGEAASGKLGMAKTFAGTGYEKDKLYRQYTAREAYDLLFEQGGKSTESALPGLSTGRTLNTIRGRPGRIAFAKLGAAPQAEDMAYRYAVFADAIRSGRSESEAVELARRSMYDAGDLTSVERSIQRNLLFYTWMRNNFVNFVKNAASSEGRSRISKALKYGKMTEQLAPITEEDRQWAATYLQTKAILRKINFGQKEVYITTPSSPVRDALSLFTQFLNGDISTTAMQMLNPSIKAGLDIESPFAGAKDKVPAEHVAYLKAASAMSGASISDILSAIVGSEVIARQARPDEGAVDGYIYPLTTPQQQSIYNRYTNIASFFGATTLANDWSKLVSGEGTASESLSTGARIASNLSGLGVAAGVSPYKQDYYNKLGKIAAIKGATASLQKYENKPTEGETAPPAQPLAPGIDPALAGKAGSEESRGGTDVVAKQERQALLGSEIDRLMRDLYTGKYPEYLVGGNVTPSELARFEEEKGVTAKIQEIDKLDKEINALNRANASKSKAKPAKQEQPKTQERERTPPRERTPGERTPPRERTPGERTPGERTPRERTPRK